jgi:hypothetical protein
MRRAIPIFLLLLTLGACASAAGTGGGGNASLITSDELRELDGQGLSVLEVIQRLRPTWTRGRGGTSFAGGPAVPRAVVDGVPYGDLSELSGVSAREAQVIELVGAGDATTRFGTGYPGGAILVRTR